MQETALRSKVGEGGFSMMLCQEDSESVHCGNYSGN